MDRREVVARFPDMDRARLALAALERGGIEGADASLHGRPVAKAAGEHDTRERDAGVSRHMASRVAIGALVGSLVAGLGGLLVGLVAFDGTGGIVAAGMVGLLAGGAVGAAIGGYGTPAETEDWELTHQPEPDGPVVVLVQADDPDELARAVEILEAKDPISVERRA
jgi:outer membrane lipoprotein SlyB